MFGLTTLILLLFLNNISKNILAVTYGSDTAVSIVTPMNIPTATDNIIKTFAAAKNGFAFADALTSCSWQSIFPVSGPISLKGGKLWLMSDLTLNNTGSFADLGTIMGANHVVDLSQYAKTFYSGANPTGQVPLSVHLIGLMTVNIWSPELTLHLTATAKLMFTAFQGHH
jgi:hypothetical protein